MPLDQATRALHLQVGSVPKNDLLLTGLRGNEEMSRLFEFELEMISDRHDISPRDVVGQNVTFSVQREDEPRFFNGFVSRFSAGDEDEQGRRNYRARVVPWLWFLTRTTDCRIFQNKTVVEIIEQVFTEMQFTDFETAGITGNHPKREYCVQYRESDFDFVSRLMEEEGIFYVFAHENGRHVMKMADTKTAYVPCEESQVDMPRTEGSHAVTDHLLTWQHRFDFRTGRVAQSDYNFKTPSTDLLATDDTVIDLPGVQSYEMYDYPGLYVQTGDGRSLARVRMQELEADHDLVEASSQCKTFTPGGTFTIGTHRCATEEGKSYVITSIEHVANEAHEYETGGSGDIDYRNRFTCIPDDVEFRPARSTARPVIRGPQTAVVVGPAGEEIYTDEHARVKCQFHWDRRGKHDENSSCWIRVSQVHAGKKWGAVDLPRIGEEVIVDFLEGNPDRPVISGRVYNGENTPPFSLAGGDNAANKTRRGNKTKTYKGSGFNEMTMDDTPGAEQIRMNAQHNMDTNVNNNQSLIVGNDRSAKIGNNSSLKVANNATENVGVNKKETVGSDKTIDVGNKLVVNAGSSITLKCGASKLHMNSGGVITLTGTIITIAAAANAAVAAPLTQVIGGAMLTTIGGINMLEGGVTHVGAAGLCSISGGKLDIAGGMTNIKGAPIKLN